MKHGLNTDSPEELNSNPLIAMLVSVLLTIHIFAACANYFEQEVTEETEKSRLKSTRSYLRSLCFLLFNVFWCGRRPCWVPSVFNPWLIQVNDRIAGVIPGE